MEVNPLDWTRDFRHLYHLLAYWDIFCDISRSLPVPSQHKDIAGSLQTGDKSPAGSLLAGGRGKRSSSHVGRRNRYVVARINR